MHATRAHGYIRTAVEDQTTSWQAPATAISADGGSWRFADDGVQPTFDKNEYWNDTDGDSDVAYTSNEDEPRNRVTHPRPKRQPS